MAKTAKVSQVTRSQRDRYDKRAGDIGKLFDIDLEKVNQITILDMIRSKVQVKTDEEVFKGVQMGVMFLNSLAHIIVMKGFAAENINIDVSEEEVLCALEAANLKQLMLRYQFIADSIYLDGWKTQAYYHMDLTGEENYANKQLALEESYNMDIKTINQIKLDLEDYLKKVVQHRFNSSKSNLIFPT